MNRRLLIAIGILTLLLLIAGVVYFLGNLGDGAGQNQDTETPLFGTPRDGVTPPPASSGDGEGVGDGVTVAPSPEKVTFTKVSSAPVAGSVLFRRDGAEYLRYVERGSGHVYELALGESSPTRITNTTIPGVHEAVWLPNGSGVYLLLLDETGESIRTFYGVPTQSEGDEDGVGVLAGSFIQNTISRISPSPDGTKIFFFEEDSSGARGVVARPDNTGRSLVINPAVIREYLIEWVSNRDLLLTTKPSGGVPGHAYFALGSSPGGAPRLLGDIPGLMTLPSGDGKYVLYAESTGSNVTMGILAVSTRTSLPVAIGTIPEKCAWGASEDENVYCATPYATSAGGIFPDVWYQGLASFSDNLWSIDAKGGGAQLLVSVAEYVDEVFDMTDLNLNAEASVFTFINKKDGSLWKVTVER